MQEAAVYQSLPVTEAEGEEEYVPREKDDMASWSDMAREALTRNPDPKAPTPYETTELENRGIRRLIYFYYNIVIPTGTCPGPKRRCVAHSMQNKASFHAIMFTASLHFSDLDRGVLSPEALYHRGQSIRFVNEILGSDQILQPGNCDFDMLVTSISLMVLNESYGAAFDQAKVHWNGLYRLLTLVGGVDVLGMDGNPKRLSMWADIALTSALEIRPRLRSSDHDLPYTFYFNPPSAWTSHHALMLEKELTEFTSSRNLSSRLATAFWGLRAMHSPEITALRTLEAVKDTTDFVDIQLTDRYEKIAHLVSPLCLARAGTYHSIFRLFGWACMIHLDMVLRGLTAEMPLIKLFSRRIWTTVERCPFIEEYVQRFPDMMMWILMTGGMAAPKDLKGKFAKELARWAALRGVDDQADLEDVSLAFLWSGRGEGEANWRKVDSFLVDVEGSRLPT